MKSQLLQITLVIIAIAHVIDAAYDVTTREGTVHGFNKTVLGKTIVGYLGIPYAAPPVGELRFKRPQNPLKYETRQATTPAPDCMQEIHNPLLYPLPQGIKLKISEDCLYLNIWKPETADKLPVFVWFENAKLMMNKADRFVYDAFVAEKNVIVVTPNFRIGVFGFLYLGLDQKEAQGNTGLFDQLKVLEWIKNNIEKFGGEPSLVTLLGYGGLHNFTPLSKGLYSKNILYGPSETNFGPVVAYNNANQLAKELKCDKGGVQEIAKCLREVPATTLLSQQTKMAKASGFFENPFVPVFDGNFLSDHPANLGRADNIRSVPTILGINTGFAPFHLSASFPREFPRFGTPNITADIFQSTLKKILNDPPTAISSSVNLLYNFMAPPTTSYLTKIKQIVQEGFLEKNVYGIARVMERNNITAYCYAFDYRSSNLAAIFPLWNDAKELHHYAAGYPLAPPPGFAAVYAKDPAADKKVSNMVMDYFVNFAKTGDPNPTDGSLPKWPTCKSQFIFFNRSGDAEEFPINGEEASQQVDSWVAIPDTTFIKTMHMDFWLQYLTKLKADYCKVKGRENELICQKLEKLKPKPSTQPKDKDGVDHPDYTNIIIIVACGFFAVLTVVVLLVAYLKHRSNKSS